MRTYGLTLCLLLLATPAAAQALTERPTVDCSLLTPDQAVGLPCAPAPPPPTSDCDPRPNPYLEPERALRCLHAAPKPEPMVWEPGGVYSTPYNHRAVVLSITRGVSGVPVVTMEWLDYQPGEVFSFRLDRQRQPWLRVK